MSNLPPPVFDFDRLKPVTMTVIVSYDIGELNLPALFAFLPVTDQSLPAHLNIQKKQGKIRLPSELNIPGEILSMRYDKQVRGINRSEKAKSFSHSIIIDMGTSERIISVKLSRTLEFTGPTSIDIAREAAEALLGKIKQCQEDLLFIREHQEAAIFVGAGLANELVYSGQVFVPQDLIQTRIDQIFRRQVKGYPQDRIEQFMDFIITFNRNLYTGSLKLSKFECEMANVLFNLGYAINQVSFARVMNQTPFRCTFNNYKSASAVVVQYDYVKHDRNTGLPKAAKHTIRVNRSGHVRHSGPNLEAMKAVYYAFMQKVLQNYQHIQSSENSRQQLKVIGPSRQLSIEDWKLFMKQEDDLRTRILRGEVPIAQGEPIIVNESIIEITIQPEEIIIPSEAITNYPNLPSQSTLQFDYAPLVITC